MIRSDLPFGSEFSPSQIALTDVLKLVKDNEGDWHSLEASILKKYFLGHGKKGEAGKYNRGKLANNCKLGLISYGIIDRAGTFTTFGKKLFGLIENEPELYKTLARHILLNLRGMALVKCIQEMTVAGEDVNLTTLREGLAARGTHYPAGGKHPSIMRLWLEKAGIFVGGRWQINETQLRSVLGADPNDYDILARFSPEQRAFLLALANTGEHKPQPANAITKLATATYGIKFPEKSLPKLVLDALQNNGYITATKTTSGRGAKPFLVAPTKKLQADIVAPLLEQLKNQLDHKLLDLLAKPLKDIVSNLKSKDRYIAGLALEALAFKLMRILGMDYIATRLRASVTGGAEVDLIFESSRLVFSRWQVQCKNTSRVALDDVAKEVGLTHFLKSNVIVIISTGEIGGEARRYANKIMTDSNLNVVMIDRSDVEAVQLSTPHIVDVFKREANNAMTLKKLNTIT